MLGIHSVIANTKFSKCLGINLRKKLDISIVDDERPIAQKPQSDHSDKKIIPDFLNKIHGMIKRKSWQGNQVQSQGSRNVSVFIWQVVHEDIWYFLYKIRKGLIFL